jgi:ferredoxin
VGSDGKFDFLSCYFHNYRERVGGFVEWVKHLVNSADFDEYKTKVTEAETVSMWQNLSICPQTKCDRCMAVCPAGERNLGEFLFDRTGYIDRVIKPLQNRAETVYVVPGSAAEARVKEKFPMKTAKYVGL